MVAFVFAKHLPDALQLHGYKRCMSTTPYKPRVVERELQSRLESAGAVVIEGPKACGKTATAETMAASEVRLDVKEQTRRAAEIEPALVLDGFAPRLIDEWQVVPAIWNHVRRAVDARRKPGQFILTGSAVPARHWRLAPGMLGPLDMADDSRHVVERFLRRNGCGTSTRLSRQQDTIGVRAASR